MAAWPRAIQDAVRLGKVKVGMTKPQVLASLGPPRLDVTSGTDAAQWTYWTLDEAPYVLDWDDRGLLRRVVAADSVRALVEVEN